MIKYTSQYKFVLDSLWFAYRGEIFKGSGSMEWNPTDGFHIDALLDKDFAPVHSFKTLGQTIINDRSDAFTIWLEVRGLGAAIAPNVFPLAQKKSLIPDNHLSIDQDRVIFIYKWPKECDRKGESWSGSAVFLTEKRFEFSDSLKLETSLAGEMIEAQLWTGLSHKDTVDFSLSGRHLDDNNFELNWSLTKSRWTKTDAWNLGEAARRAFSIIFAQTIWIANVRITRGNREIFDFRKKSEVESLRYNFRPLIDIDSGGRKQCDFNKGAFLKLVVFFRKGGSNAEVCWNVFRQMADASRQDTIQGRELLLSTILDAIFNTINNRPFTPGGHYGRKDREKDMANFQQSFLTAKWESACKKALESHARLRHRNAHPDWLTTPCGVLSREELKKSTKDLVFLSRFYGYIILALAGFKDLEALFPIVRFSDEVEKSA
jgi:hypothetical protein